MSCIAVCPAGARSGSCTCQQGRDPGSIAVTVTRLEHMKCQGSAAAQRWFKTWRGVRSALSASPTHPAGRPCCRWASSSSCRVCSMCIKDASGTLRPSAAGPCAGVASEAFYLANQPVPESCFPGEVARLVNTIHPVLKLLTAGAWLAQCWAASLSKLTKLPEERTRHRCATCLWCQDGHRRSLICSVCLCC
jgi:hypothetical protein